MKKRILALLLSGLVLFSLHVFVAAEEPVQKLGNHWAAEEFTCYTDMMHISAIEGWIAYCPNTAATRGEVLQLMQEALGMMSYSGEFAAPFEDVPPAAECREAVQWAKEWGLITGTPSGKFEPNRAITREEMVTILFRLHQNDHSGEENTATEAQLADFRDKEQISPYAKEAMCWAVGHSGVLTGKRENMLASHATATRLEVAVMLKRYLNGNAVQQVIAKSKKVTYRKRADSAEILLRGDDTAMLYRTFLGHWEKLMDESGTPEEFCTFTGDRSVEIGFLREGNGSLMLFVTDSKYPNLNGVYRVYVPVVPTSG